jgi:nucleotide-binding universal stress UspA family protein
MSVRAMTPILICYDGSEAARRAIETTGGLFPGHRAIVLHAWSPMPIIAASYLGALAMLDYDDEAAQADAAKIAEEGCNLAKEAGLSAQPEITEVTLDGTPRAILDIAEQYEAELIVLGARGLSTMKSMVLGSVSHGVAQHADLPVLIVPPPVRRDTAPQRVELAAART